MQLSYLENRMDFFSNLYSDYKKNSREFFQEEPFDFLVFRPLAYVTLRLFNWSFLRPNHFSFAALSVAIMSGYWMATGTAKGFVYGGIGIFIFSVLDCCDGMLARMKKNGSEFGALIDMFVDLLSNLSFYFGLFIGLGKDSDYELISYLAIASLFFIAFHAGIYNYYKKQFLFYQENNPEGREREIDKYRRDLDNYVKKGGNFFKRMLLKMFLIFSRVQKNPKNNKACDVQKYLKYNRSTLPMWGIVAGSTHLFLLSVSLISHRIGLYFFFSLIIFNFWIVFISIVQSSVSGSLEKSA